MNSNERSLLEEGTVNFWVVLKDNPQFSDLKSNIRFMLNNNVGGVSLTILKEQEFIRVEINNPKYGTVDLIHNISSYLKESMMVTLTWKKNVVSLFLNGELVKETPTKRSEHMISVVYPNEIQKMFQFINVSNELIERTVNDRHRGSLIYSNPLRLGAIHWFDDDSVFVNGVISKTHQEGNNIKLEEFTLSLLLRLTNKLPSGNISKDMKFNAILGVIAKSFGFPVTCHKSQKPAYLHIDSDWDGETSVDVSPGAPFLLQGTFNPENKTCSFVWAFSLEKYKEWFTSFYKRN